MKGIPQKVLGAIFLLGAGISTGVLVPQVGRWAASSVPVPENAIQSEDRRDEPTRSTVNPDALPLANGSSEDVVLPSIASPDNELAGQSYHVGDKLKIGFYERLEFDEAKWGRQRVPPPAFHQRTELSGEFSVNDDGTISLPLLGSFSATKGTSRDLESSIANAAETLMGRKGFVTTAIVERQPIYVLGPVKNPGSYKYAPGMTVLHAVALAGGLDRAILEPWQRIEGVRETGRQQSAIERTTRFLARAAVLKSEQEESPPQVPPRLTEIVSDTEARAYISEQQERRKSLVWTRRSREAAAKATVENARNEVDTLAERVGPLNDIIKLRSDRLESMRSLTKSNVVANPVLIQAQSELSEVQERRQMALTAITLAKQRLTLAEQELARQKAESQAELEREVTVNDQDLADSERDLESSQGILKVIKRGAARREMPASETSVTYEVVRRNSQAATIVRSTGTTRIEPGDLVRVRQDSQPESTSGAVRLR